MPTAEIGAASGLRAPMPYDGRAVLDPEWILPPQHLDGVFVSAAEGERALEFTAIASDGEALWTAERPLSCSGFTLSRNGGDAIAILTDVETTAEALAQTTASAYDLKTGEHLWGPVDVPGPHRGPGLVFAYAPKSVMGESGPRVVLDPATGAVVFDESAEDLTVVGEFRGTVLLVRDGALEALDARGSEMWRVKLAERGWGEVLTPAPAHGWLGDATAVVETSDYGGVLLELATGDVIAEHVHDALFDTVTETMIVRAGDTLQALDATGTPRWQVTVPPNLAIAGAAEVMVYLTEGGTVRVVNALTGAEATAYFDGAGRLVVPLYAAPSGAAVLAVADSYVFAPMA
ncbi:hypothetical protein [Agrococcus casei]|uniref:hypothetical protein n=1 Tax=Agrococcus casei TaxID=343512 RepID=UPI003F91D8A3